MAIESSPFQKAQQAVKSPAERLVDTAKQGSEEGELSLRPKRLSEYIGQNKMKEQLSISLTAAKIRGEALDHLLLHGPPGLGKTSLAHVIAMEMGANLRATSGPAIERPGDLVAILSNLEDGAVLFIDEIHRLNRLAEEFLYPAMEDFEMDMTIGQGPSARTVKIPLAKFTLIGATTRPGLLTNPLRDRFGIVQGFEFYEEADLTQILIRSADILGVGIDERGAGEIASRSRGTPRIANRLLKRARDYAQVKADGVISHEVADAALKMMEVDRVGLDSLDRLYLTTLIDRFDGGPTGAETMAATLRLERDTIEDVLEPFLMMAGFLQRTPRGRTATRRAYEHLNRKMPKSRSTDAQPGLLDLES